MHPEGDQDDADGEGAAGLVRLAAVDQMQHQPGDQPHRHGRDDLAR
jgi:hypothetical protein